MAKIAGIAGIGFLITELRIPSSLAFLSRAHRVRRLRRDNDHISLSHQDENGARTTPNREFDTPAPRAWILCFDELLLAL